MRRMGQDLSAGAGNTQPAPKYLITVAICTRNRAHFLEKAVRSVVPQLSPRSELLVINNASTDTTAETIASLEKLFSIRSVFERELGLSAARNTALRNSQGKWVLFLDDDATASPGWISAYEKFLAKPPSDNIACVGGSVLPDFESPPPRWLPSNWGTLDYGPEQRELKSEGGPWGGNAAYHRDRALAIGAFNTALGRKGNFFGAQEESDLNTRLRQQGGELWWIPNAPIKHFLPSSRMTLRALMRAEFAQGRSSAVIRTKEKPSASRALYSSGRLLFLPVNLVFLLLVALLSAPFSRGRCVKALLRSWRLAGFARQLVSSLFSKG